MKISAFATASFCFAILAGCGENPLCEKERRARLEVVDSTLHGNSPFAWAIKKVELEKIQNEISQNGISCKDTK
jgi:hypothetical protein